MTDTHEKFMEQARDICAEHVDVDYIEGRVLVSSVAAAILQAHQDGIREGKRQAAEIAKKLASDQRETNARHPRHAEVYPDWVTRITHFERVASAILSTITDEAE